MKISTSILRGLYACASGFNSFSAKHGDTEILFSDCVKSESNSISDYFWFIRKQPINDDHKKDLQLLAIDFAERVLPIFESKHPCDKRPRVAIETAKLYLSGESTLDALKEARRAAAADAAAYAAAAAADYADAAAYAADAAAYAAAAAAYAAYAAYAAATAAYADAAAYAAYAYAYAAAADAADADADADERSWQKQRLAELMVKWGW